MAVYTDVSDRELQGFLRHFDVGRALSFKGIAEGVINSNFLLETTSGRFILTVYEPSVAEDDLPFFLGLMQWLQGHGFPSAAPAVDRRGRLLGRLHEKPAALIQFMPGLSLRRPEADHCRTAGEALARLHLAAEGFDGRRANALGAESWRGLLDGLANEADRFRPGLAALLRSDLGTILARWPSDGPAGVVHADYFPDNVLFLDDGVSAVIDFYFSANDLLAYDLAVAINAWCFDDADAYRPDCAEALVEGYERGRQLTAAEHAALPVLAWGAAMRFFLTRLADWGAAPPGALVRPKDPGQFERRLAFHRARAR